MRKNLYLFKRLHKRKVTNSGRLCMIKYFLNKTKSIFDYCLSFFIKQDDGTVLAPCIGDIIQYEDESRQMVMSIVVEDGMWDVRFSKNVIQCTDKRGRTKNVLQVSKDPEPWPPQGCKIFRDGKVIIPEKKYKFKFN